MTLDPARPEKTRRGVWGGVAPPVGLGFGIPPAARVRVRPHYRELPVPDPRRDMGLGQVLQAESKKRFVHSHPPSLNIRNIIEAPPKIQNGSTTNHCRLQETVPKPNISHTNDIREHHDRKFFNALDPRILY